MVLFVSTGLDGSCVGRVPFVVASSVEGRAVDVEGADRIVRLLVVDGADDVVVPAFTLVLVLPVVSFDGIPAEDLEDPVVLWLVVVVVDDKAVVLVVRD